ncbi:MAG: YfjI family protein [Paracoccaceae bacterium]
MNTIAPIPYQPEGPQPLLREIPPGDPYPVDALGPLKGAVMAVQQATQAPAAIAAQSALSVASLAVQAHADVETLAGYSPVSLFCLTVAQSGERKSGCDKLVMNGLREFERDQTAQYKEDMAEWQLTHRLWTAKRDRLLKDASGANASKATSAEADLKALGPEPAQPLSPKLTASEPTIEGLVKLYLVGQPSLGLFSDEGGGFIGGHAMNSDNRMKTVAGLSKLWDGEPPDRVRAGDGAVTLYGRRLAMHLMVQPVAARPLLADPIASGQGFLARFLVTEPPSNIGARLSRPNADVASVAKVAMAGRLNTLLAHPKPADEDKPQELRPRPLYLSGEAKDMLFEYYRVTELAQGAGGGFEHVKSFASKSAEQAARIAGVLTLWRDLNAVEVSGEAMADAIDLAQFYLNEAKRLAEAAMITERIEQAEHLRGWILNGWPEQAAKLGRDTATILPRDVVLYGPNSMRETAKVKSLLSVLADHQWLHQLEAGAVIDGASRNVAFRIVRG